MQGEVPVVTAAVSVFRNCYYDSFNEIYNHVMPSLGYTRTPGTALDLALELLDLPVKIELAGLSHLQKALQNIFFILKNRSKYAQFYFIKRLNKIH